MFDSPAGENNGNPWKPMGNPWETHGKPMVNPRVNDFFGWLDGVIMLKRITSPKDKHGKVEDCS
jgi:hypothetical protein